MTLVQTGERARIVPGAETLGDDLVLLSVSPNSGRILTKQKIDYGLMGAELVRLAAVGRVDIEAGRVVVRNAAAFPSGPPATAPQSPW